MSDHPADRTGERDARERLAAVARTLADDGYAMTFQTLGQYRAALLAQITHPEGCRGDPAAPSCPALPDDGLEAAVRDVGVCAPGFSAAYSAETARVPSAPVTPPPDPLRVNDAEFLDALAAGLEAEWISNASHLVDGDIQTVEKLRAVAKRVRAATVPEAEQLAEAMYHALDEGADVSPRYAWASIQENFRDYWRAKARAVLARLSRGRTEQEETT
jgi:hypothetical protein